MAKICEWFGEELPKPESIYLIDYVESENGTEGTFLLPNGESIRLCQAIEDINSFIEKSEKEDTLEKELIIEKIQVRRREMNG